MFCLDAVLVKRFDYFQASKNAQVAVVATAGRDRVDVRTGHHWRAAAPAGAYAHDVTDAVHRDCQAQFTHPLADQIAAGLVLVGQGQARTTAALDRPDRRQPVQALMQTLNVDLHLRAGNGVGQTHFLAALSALSTAARNSFISASPSGPKLLATCAFTAGWASSRNLAISAGVGV